MAKKKKSNKPFTPIFHNMLYSEEWLDLSNSAKLLYIYIKAGYNGDNNGAITLPYSRVKKIISSATTCKSIKELKNKNWIEVINPNRGLYKESSKYKLTFKHDRALK